MSASVRLPLRAALALQRMVGARPGPFYREFLTLERARPQDVRRLQDQRLTSLLRQAAQQVPFYRARVGAARPELSDFPVLTKRDVRDHFLDLMNPALRAAQDQPRQRGYGWIAVKTGGSTGVPTTVIHEGSFRDAGRASRLYSQHLCGFPFGTPYHRLWGSMAEIHHLRESRAARITRFLARETLWNAFRLSDPTCRAFLDDLRNTGARHLMAYVDALDQVARFAERAGGAPPLTSIMACAGTVSDDFKARVERVFQARVHNKYGSRDCADLACACERGGLHVYAHQALLEIVDARGAACPPGRTGRVLVTLLGNAAFPLIRYEIGDLAAWAEDTPCPCGRPFPLLQRIEGRSVEFLRSAHGDFVSPSYVIHLIGVVHNPGLLRRFQLVQDPGARFTLSVELEPGRDTARLPELRDLILRDLRAVLGADARIDWTVVDRIPETASGKFLSCINRDRTP